MQGSSSAPQDFSDLAVSSHRPNSLREDTMCDSSLETPDYLGKYDAHSRYSKYVMNECER